MQSPQFTRYSDLEGMSVSFKFGGIKKEGIFLLSLSFLVIV